MTEKSNKISTKVCTVDLDLMTAGSFVTWPENTHIQDTAAQVNVVQRVKERLKHSQSRISDQGDFLSCSSALHWWNHQQASGLLRGRQSRGRGSGPSIWEQNRADCGQRQWAQKLSGRVKQMSPMVQWIWISKCFRSVSYMWCIFVSHL